jgi:uncharacterized RDD family membrane protein YckC
VSSPSTAGPAPTSYAGQRLGLPAEGPGAVAGWGRRVLALVIDWLASLLVAGAIAGPEVTGSTGWQAWLPMLVFLLEAGFLTALMGGSFGQLVLRVVVVRIDNRPVSLLRALGRTFLICLVVPPLVFDRDRRGLHDLVARTVTLRR